MRASVMYGAGDDRIENVPDATLVDPPDAPATWSALKKPPWTHERCASRWRFARFARSRGSDGFFRVP